MLFVLILGNAWGANAHASGTLVQARQAARVATAELSRGVRTGGIPSAAAASGKASIAAALQTLGALDTPSKTLRRDELASQIELVGALAQRGALVAGRLPELFHQLDANRRWFASRQPPAPLARVTLPGDPIVYGYYPGHGLVLQPLFTWSQGEGYWFAHDWTRLQALIDAMRPLAVPEPGGYLSWDYLFDYGSGLAPWRSAIAQAEALQTLVRATWATGDLDDLEFAQQLVVGFKISVAQGGLRDPSGRAWWPLYSFAPGDRILNGDLQSVIALYDYAFAMGASDVYDLAQSGAREAAERLPAYDTGAWSMYDQYHEADLGYHDLMTLQLRQLATRTGNGLFTDYADRFAAYRKTPPVLSAPATPPATRLRLGGSVSASVGLDKLSSVTLTITNAVGAALGFESLGTFARGSVAVRWSGLLDGRHAPAGSYTLSLTARDLAGNTSPATPILTVQVLPAPH
jgi:hypothetical protein